MAICCRAWWAAFLVLVLAAVPVAGQALPLAVENGRCSFVLKPAEQNDKRILILGSLAPDLATHTVRVQIEPCTGPEAAPLEKRKSEEPWRQSVIFTRERLARATRLVQQEEYPPCPQPAASRTFHVFVGEHDFHSAASYVAVPARLQALGKHCQVYVDEAFPSVAELQATIADAIRVFDEEIYPEAKRSLGHVTDVDRDGRFTIFFTPWLSKLQGGKVSLGGFVRGSDFYRDLAAPLGNCCDMMYLNTNLQPGPFLHALLAHEYTHAAFFCEHVLAGYLPELPRRDEEAWLNEGLAHCVEDRYGWANLDYRMAAFLDAPERYSLVVPDYYSVSLWRSAGHRGAAYLFLRWCSATQDDQLAARLVRSSLCGVPNLELATGTRFCDLFRNWTIALACGAAPSPEVREILHLKGPRCHELSLEQGLLELGITGTSAAFCQLPASTTTFLRVTVQADPAMQLQSTLVQEE